ncbi:MAG: acyl-CoA dehydrogenase family protein [Bacteroidales bacterium]|nr:acyl-CoA dehydrogenase family protein [Bacteroidales bacterium]
MANFYNDNSDLQFHLTHPLMNRIIELRERGFADKNKFDYAPSNLDDAIDSYQKVMELCGEICADVIAPNAEANDIEGHSIENDHLKYNSHTLENYEALRKASVWGITLPRKYNGLNFSNVPYIMVGEMISRADGGFANFWGLQDCAETINEFASEELKQEFLPLAAQGKSLAMVLTEPDAGSDLQSVQLKARYDADKNQWFLNGVKRFITNGDADIQLVLARSEEGTGDGRGLSLFIYEKDKHCQIVRRVENKLGIHGSPTCELVYKDAPARLLGDRKMGLIKYVMSLMYCARLGVGGQSVGIAEAAYREAIKYANEREQFKSPIIKFPAVYQLLGNMNAKLKGMRSLLYETARFVDMSKLLQEIQNNKERTLTSDERADLKYYKKMADAFTPLLKLFSSEWCNQIAYDALQIHGGSGYMKDFPIERITRDARITTIYEGTSQLQVVAAIKGVTTGIFSQRMAELDSMMANNENLQQQRNLLLQMTNDYENAIKTVESFKCQEYIDFQARNLVEMAGNIIVSYLLFTDSIRNDKFLNNANIFLNLAIAENAMKFKYINNGNPNDLDWYK